MKENNELFTTMPVGKAVARLAIPTVVSQIIVILYSMADTFFIGQTGDPNQLAALSIAFPIFTLLTAVANLFGIGANSLIARSLGQNDEKTAKKASSFCFWASIVVTLVLSVVLALFMKPILTFVGADELTYAPTKDYLTYVFVIGGIPTVAGLVLDHLVRAVGRTREAGIGLAIGGILNIILNPVFIFIFHMWGLPALQLQRAFPIPSLWCIFWLSSFGWEKEPASPSRQNIFRWKRRCRLVPCRSGSRQLFPLCWYPSRSLC